MNITDTTRCFFAVNHEIYKQFLSENCLYTSFCVLYLQWSEDCEVDQMTAIIYRKCVQD